MLRRYFPAVLAVVLDSCVQGPSNPVAPTPPIPPPATSRTETSAAVVIVINTSGIGTAVAEMSRTLHVGVAGGFQVELSDSPSSLILDFADGTTVVAGPVASFTTTHAYLTVGTFVAKAVVTLQSGRVVTASVNLLVVTP